MISRFALFFLVLFCPGLLHAATYTLPAACGTAPFHNCVASGSPPGSTCTCNGNVQITQNNAVVFGSPTTLVFTGSASLTVQQNADWGLAGQSCTVNVTGTGSISLQQNSASYCNFSTTSGTISVQQNGDVVGNLTSATGTVDVANNGTVTGNVSAPNITGGGVIIGNCSDTTPGPTCSSASARPLVTTNAATNVSYTSATLNATVTPNTTNASSISFEYGLTTGYGTNVAASPSSLTATGNSSPVTAAITGLTCNTTYYYRARATNTAGTTLGNGLSFTTSGCLLADYHFDECSYNGTSGEVIDTLGSYHATSKGNKPTTQATGVVGRSLNLNALNKYITPNSKIPLPGAYTLSYWMYSPLPAPAGNTIYPAASLAKHTDNICHGDFLNIRSDFGYVWRVYQQGAGGANGTYSFNGLSGWHHIAVSATGSTSTLYVDGVSKGTAARRANADLTTLGLGFIGASCDDPVNQTLRAPIDEFLVFNGVVSANDIQTIYNNQLAGKNRDGTTRTPQSCGGLDHIRIVHDGSGTTCAPETLTVKSCADSGCTSLYTAGTVTGNVTWGGTPIPFTTTPASSGQTTVSLSSSTVQTVTLGSASVSPVPANTVGDCQNTAGGTSCNLTFSAAAGCFDVVEVGNAAATSILTKLAGTAFNLDVITSNGANYTGALQVALVDPDATGSNGNCSNGNAGLYTVASNFSNQNRKSVLFNYPDAAKKVRVRVIDAASAKSCSSDDFAIRPAAFTLSTTSAMVPASDVLKAGDTNFNLTADPGVTAGYLNSTGFPAFDFTKIKDHTGAAIDDDPTRLTGGFDPGTGGAVSSGGFKYYEVGTFTLHADAVVDSDFTAVDSVKGDCVSDSTSNSAPPYGCNIGSSSLGPLGRFTPHHYKTEVSVPGCGLFSYSGQPFSVKVTALDALGGETVRFDNATGAAYTKTVTLSSPDTSGSVKSGTGVVAAGLFSNGHATVTTPVFNFNSARTGPKDIVLRATDNDTPSISSSNVSEGTAHIHSGRIRLQNAHGSELLDLAIPLSIQFWDSTKMSWEENSDDSCTSISPGDFAFSFPTGTVARPNNLAACETAVSVSGTTPNFTVSLAKPGKGNNGWTDLTLNLGAVAAGNTCTSVGTPASAASTANLPWLQFNWTGATGNPKSRATFGVFKNDMIYLRENH